MVGSLQSTPHESEDGADEKAIDATNSISQPATCKAAKNAPQIIDTYQAPLVCCVSHGAVGSANANLGDIGGRCIDASHDALIISLKKDGDEGEDLDRGIELAR